MPTNLSEMKLEKTILDYLRDKHGYEEGTTSGYAKEYALDTERVKRFLLSTQKQKVENTACFSSEISERRFFTELAKQLANRGVTDVLRKGFRFISELFDMYYPLPPELNPTAQELYRKNLFCITKELAYSKENDNRIDLMVSLNGLPLITMELKNHYTGQTVENAVKQYQTDRDPKDPLLAPKRCAVHFAVDDDNIKMCTWLCGKGSWFLPFDKGVNGKKISADPGGYVGKRVKMEVYTTKAQRRDGRLIRSLGPCSDFDQVTSAEPVMEQDGLAGMLFLANPSAEKYPPPDSAAQWTEEGLTQAVPLEDKIIATRWDNRIIIYEKNLHACIRYNGKSTAIPTDLPYDIAFDAVPLADDVFLIPVHSEESGLQMLCLDHGSVRYRITVPSYSLFPDGNEGFLSVDWNTEEQDDSSVQLSHFNRDGQCDRVYWLQGNTVIPQPYRTYSDPASGLLTLYGSAQNLSDQRLSVFAMTLDAEMNVTNLEVRSIDPDYAGCEAEIRLTPGGYPYVYLFNRDKPQKIRPAVIPFSLAEKSSDTLGLTLQ